MTDPVLPEFNGSLIFASTTDLIQHFLKPLEGMVPGLKVRSMIEDGLTTPYVFARMTFGSWTSDSFHNSDNRFSRRAVVNIDIFTDGPDGDSAGWALSELCWQTLYAAREAQTVVPGIGSIAFLRINSPARRVSDWATSTGVQQYANLNKGYTRYQAVYGIVQRPDRRNPMTAADLVALSSL